MPLFFAYPEKGVWSINNSAAGNMKKFIIIAAFLLSTVLNYQYGFCRSWDDLDEGEHEIYGSEREEKFPVKAFFTEKELWENHYSFMLFWLYKYTDYPKYKSTRMLPFYYGRDSKIDNRSQMLIPPLLSYFEKDGTVDTSYIAYPLYYSSIDKKAESYEADRSLLALIWWGSEKNSSVASSYQTVFPLFYHSSELNTKNSRGDYLWINPVFFSYREEYQGNAGGEHLWWAPIVPLTFSYTDRHYGHRNIFWLMDYSWDYIDGRDSLKRFWLLPLYLWERGNNGYTAAFGPVYINNRHSNGDYYYHLLPLFSAWKESGYNYQTKSGYTTRELLTPLWTRRTVKDEKTGEVSYSNWWFPIIPLVFRSSDANEGTHTNLLWLADWESDISGSLKSFWLVPLVFHQAGESGYRFYIPFYCRPAGATDKEGYSFGIFHYYNWRETGSTVWSWLYYSDKNIVTKPPAKGDANPPAAEEYYYTHLLPVYWSWRSTNSTGQVIFPLWYNYKDKHTDIHVDLSGIAIKTFTGPLNPDLSLGVTKIDETWYLDSDYSWLYDVFSYSSRVAVKNPFGEKDDAAKDSSAENKEIKTGIAAKKEISRENSRSFSGYRFLFGMVDYEHADARKYFRFFPLAWFMWGEQGDDELSTVFPLFFSYRSVEKKESYFVTLPYAAQRQDRSYIKAYGLIMYWDEYDAEKEYYEKSVIWPLVNWYSSAEKNGYRILPLIVHREWSEEEGWSSQTFTPLSYSRDVKNLQTGEYAFRRRINPLYCSREKNRASGYSYSLFAPVVPLYYRSVEKTAAATSEKTVTPLFYYQSEESDYKGVIASSSKMWFPLLPVFYRSTYGEYSHWNMLGLLDNCSDKDYSRFFLFPLYYSTSESGEQHKNILGVIDWWRDSGGVNTSMVFPFYWWSGNSGGSSLVLFPLLSYFSSNAYSKTRFVAGAYWYESSGYQRQNFLWMFDHQKFKRKGYDRNEYSLLLTTMEFDIDPEIAEMRLLWGTLFSFEKYRKNGNYDVDALLWLAGVKRNGDYFHNRVLPLYWYSSDRYETTLVVPPALSYFSKDSNGRFDLGLLGVVYYRNEDRAAGEDRIMWLLGSLYDEVKVPERKYHSIGSLWGILWDYETEEATDFTKFTILKGLYKYIDKKGEKEHTVFWVF